MASLSTLLGTWEPDPYGQILGTGYNRFKSPLGIDGLAKWNGERFDLLAVHAANPGTGQFRNWLAQVREQFKTVCVWQIENPALEAALKRYGFTPEVEIDRFGEVLTGLRWDKPEVGRCPKCGGEMENRSLSGLDRHGREQEADWDECVKCGHVK